MNPNNREIVVRANGWVWDALALMLIAFKLLGVIDWPWWMVVLPMGVNLIPLLVIVIVAFWAAVRRNW